MKRKALGPTARRRAAKRRNQLRGEHLVKIRVRQRDGDVCRCCGTRQAESVHEIVPKSLGGKVSDENSIHLCGDGIRGCHGLAQRNEIRIGAGMGKDDLDAGGSLLGTVFSRAAIRWLKLPHITQIGHSFFISAPPQRFVPW